MRAQTIAVSYIPSDDDAALQWLQNFLDRLSPRPQAFGVDPRDLETLALRISRFRTWLALAQSPDARAAAKGAVAPGYERRGAAGTQGASRPAATHGAGGVKGEGDAGGEAGAGGAGGEAGSGGAAGASGGPVVRGNTAAIDEKTMARNAAIATVKLLVNMIENHPLTTDDDRRLLGLPVKTNPE